MMLAPADLRDGQTRSGGTWFDTTSVFPRCNCDGTAHRGGADNDGAVLITAMRQKGHTYPELGTPPRSATFGRLVRRSCATS